MSKAPVLHGARVRLSPFGVEQITPRYLAWLNDPVVNEYSRRHDMPTTSREQAAQYLAQLRPDEHVLAIEVSPHGHIGNIKFGPIDRAKKRSDIAILVGEKSAWGQGYGMETIYLVTRWLFEVEGLERVDAGSANPAFLRLVGKLGWTVKTDRRKKVCIGARVLDWTSVELHARDFRRMSEFDCCEEQRFASHDARDFPQ